ncbi:ATP-binding protein [Flavitalea sp. BT771]|uniref:AAA family ATPase n=1 Tax=Flavitalea sp. BT771 TaxID=3063329 RepID=UPI0026E48395|nr:ATP-binding protein [Flavitalea sp. BT771]MDO6435660.1 ATP-binding protein [Flavitalea sp. BT771]MDV6224561.1 ATP-binding protein [Flavitalea sp. BT771]
MEAIAGRINEQQLLQQLLREDRSEFLAMYGRRRVGKTFLIRNVYQKEMVFQMTGIADASSDQQLSNFFSALQFADPNNSNETRPADWFKAFEMLRSFLQKSTARKKVVFFDELPWIDTPHSNFLSALEHFWNAWASARTDIILVVCGSAASWMLSKLINNKGGLHNRVTRRIRLLPFTLGETEAYFKIKNIVLDRYQIIQLYMAIGGIPFYLNEIMPGKSAFQEIDRLCFTDGGLLVNEYQNLYRSLFKSAERHMTIVEALSQKNKGMVRAEIIQTSGLSNGGNTTKALMELEESGFITRTHPFEKKVKEAMYRLTDQYSLFYLKFMKDKRAFGEGSWLSRIDSPAWRAWSGYAFENICFLHIGNLKKALGISGVYTEISSWSNAAKGVQIDLLIDRRDQVICLCEIKFSKDPYSITKAYRAELEKKLSAFRTVTATRKSVFLTMITPFGLENNTYSLGFVQNSITMEELFG